ncbi:MAG: DUF475 domain-containing protein [Agitococcus sp.]|nr:DUF475 domain-containing protein [Agitococcus sp.]
MLKFYKSAFIVTFLACCGGFYLGGLAGLWAVLILSVLEVSLSFDNAVVNASVLKTWGPLWRKRFLMWGMPIAVFGMRLVFPLLIVGVVGHLSPWGAVELAVRSPADYSKLLISAHPQIAAFGGTFLMMVFLKFFLNEQKEEHWLHWIEVPLTKMARFTEVFVLSLLLISASFMPASEKFVFVAAGVIGLIVFLVVETIGSLMEGTDATSTSTSRVVKEGIGGLLYLEVLDASFSFDGVIGAFALSSDIFIIALGLGVGAMFVRSMTLMLLEKGTMVQFRYLEHGAFWAIGALAAIMFIGTHVKVPEAVTGLIGALAIGAAIWSSSRANKLDARTQSPVG